MLIGEGDGNGEIRKVRVEECRIDDATTQARNAQEQLGSEGEEPEAGDCDRLERSAEQRRQGAGAQRIAEEEVVERQVVFPQDIKEALTCL
jgi:hypothetical protein